MSDPVYYRYIISEREVDQLRHQGILQSVNPKNNGCTFLTLDFYDDPGEAQDKLSMWRIPKYRIGPIPEAMIDQWDSPLSVVPPAYGGIGGGTERTCMGPIEMPRLWNFETAQWEQF